MNEFLKPTCRPGFVTGGILLLMTGTLFMGCGGFGAWILGGAIGCVAMILIESLRLVLGYIERRSQAEKAVRQAFANYDDPISIPQDEFLVHEEKQLCKV